MFRLHLRTLKCKYSKKEIWSNDFVSKHQQYFKNKIETVYEFLIYKDLFESKLRKKLFKKKWKKDDTFSFV